MVPEGFEVTTLDHFSFYDCSTKAGLLGSHVLGQEAELELELLDQRNGEVDGAAALAALQGLEVVLVALAAAVVEHVAGAVGWLEVVPMKCIARSLAGEVYLTCSEYVRHQTRFGRARARFANLG